MADNDNGYGQATPVSSRPPHSTPQEDERIANEALAACCAALVQRLSVGDRWGLAKHLAELMAARVMSGSRITRREKVRMGVVPWLAFLDALRARGLSIVESREYLLVASTSGSLPPPPR